MRALTALLLAASLIPAAALAKPSEPDAPATIAARERQATGGREAMVGLAQTEIETSIDVGRVAPSTGGDLIGALIVSGMDDKRARLQDSATERAEAAVAPLRDALQGYNVDALALAATKAALEKPDWFGLQTIAPTKDVSPGARRSFAASAATPQSAFVSYRYALSPDFTQIRVTADIRLEHKARPKGGASPLFYRQTVTSVVQLAKRSYDHRENVALWSADNGKLAKAALVAGFAEIERLIPYALGLAPADIKAFTAKDREKGFGAGLYGPLIARDADNSENLTIWTKDGLVHIRTLPVN